MTDETYAELALRTAPDKPRGSSTADLEITPAQKQLLLMALGLTGEAGEVAEMVKKHVFHGHPMDEAKLQHLLKELGDIQWYINYGAVRCVGVEDIGAVKAANIAKLAARYPEGHFSSERSQHRAEGDV